MTYINRKKLLEKNHFYFRKVTDDGESFQDLSPLPGLSAVSFVNEAIKTARGNKNALY